MVNTILNIRIDHLPYLITVLVLEIVATVWLIIGARRRLRLAVCAVVFTLVGLLVGWILGDVIAIVGLPITTVVLCWTGATTGVLGMCVFRLVTGGKWLRVVAVFNVLVAVISFGSWVNVDAAYYETFAQVLGMDGPHPLNLHCEHGTGQSELKRCRPVSDTTPPKTGEVGSIDIKGVVSHFDARRAVIYLPPAALVRNPKPLPVILMFSGQPGEPDNMTQKAQINKVLDSYAAVHDGVAPLVVIPDQLGKSDNNTMCVNSPLGNARTYILDDVVTWIKKHLNVTAAPSGWAVSGFSEGGTCTIEFAAGYPKMFGSFLDISGEVKPTIGSDTVEKAFGGSEAAYEAVWPRTLFAKNAALLKNTYAIIGYGSQDVKYGFETRKVIAYARKAGLKPDVIVASSGHDWNTVSTVMSQGLPLLADHLLKLKK